MLPLNRLYYGDNLDILRRYVKDESVDELDLLDGVAALVDQSLLRVEEQGDDQPRLGMLETIPKYGLDRLAASGEAEALRQAN